jgi:O-methyltransferase involved in polyketide biosynthesis
MERSAVRRDCYTTEGIRSMREQAYQRRREVLDGYEGYESVSATAWQIAHRRTFTDIPYSQEIFAEFERLLREQGSYQIPAALVSPQIAPQIEARFKLVSRLLKESTVAQVLEIAAGLSPRGLEMANHSRIKYVETDLPTMISQKKRIVRTLGSNDYLHTEEGNALDLDSLRAATRALDRSKPLGVVHEGLLRYLDFGEKATVARNIRSLLGEFGGVWITPDITLKTALRAASADDRQQIEKVGRLVGINIDQNRFENVDQAQEFFEHLSFVVERHCFTEVIDELVSPNRLGQTRQAVEAQIGEGYVFVMRLRQ